MATFSSIQSPTPKLVDVYTQYAFERCDNVQTTRDPALHPCILHHHSQLLSADSEV